MYEVKFPHKEYAMEIEVNRNVLEADEFFMHFLMGKHRHFKGRPYRRGANRCHYCGALLSDMK